MSKNNKQHRVKSGDVQVEEKLVKINRVTKVVKGGRRFSFNVIMVVGNGEGVVGAGLGKANDVAGSVSKAVDDAKKNMIKVPIINGTLPHDIELRYGAAKVIMKPAAPGTGILAGGAMRAVLESAGLKDVIGKCIGSTNPHNVVKATIKGLQSLKDPKEIAKLRGISLTKVFNG